MLLTIASKWTESNGAATAGVLVVSLMFALVWKLNLWAAMHLDKQLDDVTALETRG